MGNSSIHQSNAFEIDYTRPGIPVSAAQFQPELFKEENSFFCTWHFGPETITGEGQTPEEALQDWDKNLQSIRDDTNRNDELAKHLRNAFSAEQPVKDETRRSNDAFDVSEGIPTKSEVTPDNGVLKKSRAHTSDESNKDGSEFR